MNFQFYRRIVGKKTNSCWKSGGNKGCPTDDHPYLLPDGLEDQVVKVTAAMPNTRKISFYFGASESGASKEDPST
ncbi:hypothetical protein MUN89_05660 [Halobacillus salinarum]|uniref:Uncharacterized protein n=1 Tax=Halobacillus salinarum TaxID=2932257 RepID=A0ABY4EMS6_9BACI|nr:hypothetical protein [Halobacillus salinarum]UOQ45433.1 hypothetical protein MUN89_05660 [Halobacillus salinarum]